jgi:1-acyl-sn-glycerol-3-phosphate acyltransferase
MERSSFWKSLQIVARIWTTVWFDLRTYGVENVPETGGALLVANHQSYLDPVLVAVHLRRAVSYMARDTLFTNPYLGWLIRNLHAFPIPRGKSDIQAMKETIARLEEGYLLNIYPEGSRSVDGSIGPLQRGVALVIRKANVPIVPVVIDGSGRAWGKGMKMFRRYPIRVRYGEPMHLNDCKPDEILRRLDGALRGLLAQSTADRAAEKSERWIGDRSRAGAAYES